MDPSTASEVRAVAAASSTDPEADAVFATAAELFGLLSTPIRLKIIGELCQGERNVTQLQQALETTQPNMSQHLGVLYRAGVLGRRRQGAQVLYRLRDERVGTLCRLVCTQVAIDQSPPG